MAQPSRTGRPEGEVAARAPHHHLPVLRVRAPVDHVGGRPVNWLNRHAGAFLLATVVLFGSLALWSDASRDDDRAEDQQAAARSYVLVLRSACEDRNVRDGKILAGVREAAIRLGGTADDVPELAEALAPRDCAAIYPLPKPGQAAPVRSKPAGTAPRQPFSTCKAATLAGMTPLHEGDAGYNPDLDADADGTACE